MELVVFEALCFCCSLFSTLMVVVACCFSLKFGEFFLFPFMFCNAKSYSNHVLQLQLFPQNRNFLTLFVEANLQKVNF